MSGRNSKPKNNGPASNPGRLEQHGRKLGASNEDEFRAATEQSCSIGGSTASRRRKSD